MAFRFRIMEEYRFWQQLDNETWFQLRGDPVANAAYCRVFASQAVKHFQFLAYLELGVAYIQYAMPDM